MGQLGRISQRGVDIFLRQLRVVVDDLCIGQAFRQAIQDHGDFNAGVSDARSAAADIRPRSNPCYQRLFFRVGSFLPFPRVRGKQRKQTSGPLGKRDAT